MRIGMAAKGGLFLLMYRKYALDTAGLTNTDAQKSQNPCE
jgi:hypothetical protein